MSDKILDSGLRTQFENGGMREIDEESKGRCDLVYNLFMYDLTNDLFFYNMEMFIRTGDFSYIKENAARVIDKYYASWQDAYLDLSKHYARGIKKYSDRNMEKGLPFHSMVDSALRHYVKLTRGDDDENHKAACLWNLFTLAYMVDNKSEMNDLPYKVFEKSNMIVCDKDYEKFAENDIIKTLHSCGFDAYKAEDTCIKTNATFDDLIKLFAWVEMKLADIAFVTYSSEDGTRSAVIKVRCD